MAGVKKRGFGYTDKLWAWLPGFYPVPNTQHVKTNLFHEYVKLFHVSVTVEEQGTISAYLPRREQPYLKSFAVVRDQGGTDHAQTLHAGSVYQSGIFALYPPNPEKLANIRKNIATPCFAILRAEKIVRYQAHGSVGVATGAARERLQCGYRQSQTVRISHCMHLCRATWISAIWFVAMLQGISPRGIKTHTLYGSPGKAGRR